MNNRLTTIIRTSIALGILAALVLLAGCAKSAPASDSASKSSDAAPAASGPMTLELIEPTDGAEVPAGTLKVTVKTSGIKFVMPSNSPVAGEGHVHFTLDDRPEVMSTEKTAELKDVAPGEHTLKAELVQNDTTPFSPAVEQVITFTAK